jgi:hypothetical protein
LIFALDGGDVSLAAARVIVLDLAIPTIDPQVFALRAFIVVQDVKGGAMAKRASRFNGRSIYDCG